MFHHFIIQFSNQRIISSTFTFIHIYSPSSKFTIFISFTIQYDLNIVDPSSMQDRCQILTSLLISSLYLSGQSTCPVFGRSCRFQSCQGLIFFSFSHAWHMLIISSLHDTFYLLFFHYELYFSLFPSVKCYLYAIQATKIIITKK